MKILLVNKFAHSKGKSGGVGSYLAQVEVVLQEAGHTVEYYGMQDEHSRNHTYYDFFAPELDLSSVGGGSLLGVFSIIYSPEVRRRFRAVLDDYKPDVIHINNIYHHMSSSILVEAREQSIPVVQTVHDFHLISGNYNLFNSRTKQLDMDCIGSSAFNAIGHRCIKNSALFGAVSAFRYFFDRYSKIYDKTVKVFMMPSKFMVGLHIKEGFKKSSILHIPHYVDCEKRKSSKNSKERFVLAWGRLSPEKGYDVLIEAMRDLPNVRLKIAGDGPQREQLERLIKDQGITNVELLGFVEPSQLRRLIQRCSFSVLPSIGYENLPYAALESMCQGKPVVAPDTGGIPEIVSHRKTGLLYADPLDSSQLKAKIVELWEDEKKALEYGKSSKSFIEREFAKEVFAKKILEVYRSVQKNA